jgi:phage tail-like protein
VSGQRDPYLNSRFRVEIDGLKGTGVLEVTFPEGRITTDGRTRAVQYGPLTLRRGLSGSSEWYQWWDRARATTGGLKRNVTVVLMDQERADVTRWTYAGAVPAAYGTSQLNALRGEVLIETLELTIADFTIQFGPTRGASPSP